MNAIEKAKDSISDAIETALIVGDLSKLNSEQRVSYYNKVCESVGLNPLTRPFEYVTFQGKLILYARKDCSDQLRRTYGVSVKIVSTEVQDGIYIVRAQAKMPNGREDESIGALAIGNAKGADLANLYMKGETKAKRRVTLSICGLGMLDETELEFERQTRNEEKLAEVNLLVASSAPEAEAGEYKVPFGPFAGKTMAEIPMTELAAYVMDRREIAAKEKKQISGDMKVFLEHAETRLKG